MTDHPPPAILAFQLETLATAATRDHRPFRVNTDGHLLVAGHHAFRPVKFSPDLKVIVCELVPGDDADA